MNRSHEGCGEELPNPLNSASSYDLMLPLIIDMNRG